MRLAALVLACGCTVNGRGPDPITARPPPDPDRMPTEVLDHQDPGADTSKNRELSRTEAHYYDPDSPANRIAQSLSCGMVRCSTGGEGDWGALLIVLAVVAVSRRRKRS